MKVGVCEIILRNHLAKSYRQVHGVAGRCTLKCERLLHFIEEKKAEQDSFETDLVAGRLQDELVGIIVLFAWCGHILDHI